MARRVHLEPDNEADAEFFSNHKIVATVEISTEDGKKLSSRKEIARGDPENPMTEEEFLRKFRALAGGVLPADRIDGLIRIVRSIEAAKDVSALGRYFC